MKTLINIVAIAFSLAMASCETSEEVSRDLDHQVPECKTLTISANGQTNEIDDNISSKLLWGVVPQTNLEVVTLPTATASKGSTIDISVVISDDVALKTAELSYSNWLFSKYINFANPEGDIPLTPKSYTFTAQVTVPVDAVSTPWIDTYYFNDGSSMKITQSYHKMTLTVYDINKNVRTIPVFVKVE